MPQASLIPNAGSVIADASAPVLANGTAVITTGNGAWVEVPFPGDIAIKLVTGSVTGTSVVYEAKVEAADTNSGTATVVLGAFEELSEADDNVTRYLRTHSWKRWMRVVHTVAGGTPSVPVTVTVVPFFDNMSNTATA